MAKLENPRHGSMQFWPRRRAKKIIPKVRSWAKAQPNKLNAFLGYKVGMCTVMARDKGATSITKGMDVAIPATILECPPLKLATMRCYSEGEEGNLLLKSEIVVSDEKILSKSKIKPSTQKDISASIDNIKKNINDYSQIRGLFYSIPKSTSLGQKKPFIFEVSFSLDPKSSFDYLSSLVSKDVKISDVFTQGVYVDSRGITKGKGIQGPVKRFGITLRAHKSEKTKRGPGSLGAWCAQGHIMYRVSHAGQMGFHQRTEYNKMVLSVGKKPEEINPKSGFHKYGVVKNEYIVIKGSIQGPRKRPVLLTLPLRKNAPEKTNLTIEKIVTK